MGFFLLALIFAAGAAASEGDGNVGMVMSVSAGSNNASKVTSVYGISADDYLPAIETARRHLRPDVRGAYSHPAFDLPDAFYWVGGPIFIGLFLRVLVIFLKGYEEKEREEEREEERLAAMARQAQKTE